MTKENLIEAHEGRGEKHHDQDSDNEPMNNISLVTDLTEKGPKINEKWAGMINKQWDSDITPVSMKTVLDKYKTPENCDSLKTIRMDGEVWKNLNKYQRKNDLRYAAAQRTLIQSASAAIKLT